jgi:hypothetical protein
MDAARKHKNLLVFGGMKFHPPPIPFIVAQELRS